MPALKTAKARPGVFGPIGVLHALLKVVCTTPKKRTELAAGRLLNLSALWRG